MNLVIVTFFILKAVFCHSKREEEFGILAVPGSEILEIPRFQK